MDKRKLKQSSNTRRSLPPNNTMSTREKLAFCLKKAVENTIDSQLPTGAWEATPDPRIFETALIGFALSTTPKNPYKTEIEKARQWVRGAVPQNHSRIALLIEKTIKSIFLGENSLIDLTDPNLTTPEFRSRMLLMHALAIYAGLPLKANINTQSLRKSVALRFTKREQTQIKQWTKIEISAVHLLLECCSPNSDTTNISAALDILNNSQDDDGGYYHNPISSALTYIALCEASPDSSARLNCLKYLLRQQQNDGTWRFCTSDVWDTVLTLRSFRGYPLFNTVALPNATTFLRKSQNQDGGWAFHSSVESDNDTTSAAILALKDMPQSTMCRQGLKFLAQYQQPNGLWRTWKFTEDPPVEDVNAHIVAALTATQGHHNIQVNEARKWLSNRFREKGRWHASWYRGNPYAVSEMSEALGYTDECVHQATVDLLNSQNPDGGWGPEADEPSAPSATGLALSTILNYRFIHNTPQLKKGLDYLMESQMEGGTWNGIPEMFGPRPLLSHYQTHTQAFASKGLVKAWRQMHRLERPVKIN